MFDDFLLMVLCMGFAGLWAVGNTCGFLIRIYNVDTDPQHRFYDDFVMHTKYLIISRFFALLLLIGLVPMLTLGGLRLIHWWFHG